LSYSAAPSHDPHGRVIAVLDASCVKAEGLREAQLHTVALVDSSARLIEKWFVSAVPSWLGISRNTLYRKIKLRGIKTSRRPEGH
jgi:transcriptional regulator of acetoin/glycerol metabolism